MGLEETKNLLHQPSQEVYHETDLPVPIAWKKVGNVPPKGKVADGISHVVVQSDSQFLEQARGQVQTAENMETSHALAQSIPTFNTNMPSTSVTSV